MATQKYDLQERLINFAVEILEIAEQLPRTPAGSHVAGQLVRSGTSPAANYGEAQAAESRKDFIHKMKVCLKELRESHVWLAIVDRKGWARSPIGGTQKECDELTAIFVTSIGTARRNMEQAKV